MTKLFRTLLVLSLCVLMTIGILAGAAETAALLEQNHTCNDGCCAEGHFYQETFAEGAVIPAEGVMPMAECLPGHGDYPQISATELEPVSACVTEICKGTKCTFCGEIYDLVLDYTWVDHAGPFEPSGPDRMICMSCGANVQQ